jgi:hypothetical protein
MMIKLAQTGGVEYQIKKEETPLKYFTEFNVESEISVFIGTSVGNLNQPIKT